MFDRIAEMTKPLPIYDLLDWSIKEGELFAEYWRNNKARTLIVTEARLQEWFESDPSCAFESDNWMEAGEHQDYRVKMDFDTFMQRLEDGKDYVLEAIKYFEI